jgi:hypothetical protein
MSLIIHHRNPTLAEYQELRQRVSWPAFDDALAVAGLSKSLFSVVVQNEEGHTVGMGRIVGDEGGTNSQIGLSSSKGREAFYRSFGFTERPTDRLGAGMVLVKK